ncbi:hypothetical protein ACXDF8_15530 [Mycolicibacterium sp. CBM1]
MNQYDYQPPSTDLIDAFLHMLLIVGICMASFFIALVAVTTAWITLSPAAFQQHLVPFARQARWYLWTIFKWPRIARACGLSISEQVTHKNMQGNTTTSTKWTRPQVISVAALDHSLRIVVRVRRGQTVDDLQKAVPAIRDSIRAHSARSVVVSPGTVRMEFVLANILSEARAAALHTFTNIDRVQMGRREDGTPWILQIAERQTLTVGCSGSGKGSIFWGIAAGLSAGVRQGTVKLLAIDLKYGIEVSMGAGLFTRLATTEADALTLLLSAATEY